MSFGSDDSATSRERNDSTQVRSESYLSVPIGFVRKVYDVLIKYTQFVGPGFLIAVAHIDPGNYATDVQSRADTKYSLLFIIFMSNLFAIFLQTLCIKLGSVTGLNLAENCRKHLPRWLTIVLYVFSEAAIVSTDIPEVCILSLSYHGDNQLTSSRLLAQQSH